MLNTFNSVKTLIYDTFCRKTLKYGTFCRKNLDSALWAKRNGIFAVWVDSTFYATLTLRTFFMGSLCNLTLRTCTGSQWKKTPCIWLPIKKEQKFQNPIVHFKYKMRGKYIWNIWMWIKWEVNLSEIFGRSFNESESSKNPNANSPLTKTHSAMCNSRCNYRAVRVLWPSLVAVTVMA